MPLHGAVDSGNVEAVRVIAEEGAEIDTQQEAKSTPVHFACTRGALDMVKLMFELQPARKSSSLSLRDRNGMTVLHKSVMFDFNDVAEFLVKVLSGFFMTYYKIMLLSYYVIIILS